MAIDRLAWRVAAGTPLDAIWLDEKPWFGASSEALWRRSLDKDPRACIHLEDAEAVVMLQGRVREANAGIDLATRLADTSNEK